MVPRTNLGVDSIFSPPWFTRTRRIPLSFNEEAAVPTMAILLGIPMCFIS